MPILIPGIGAQGGDNPRFVVTNLPVSARLYEELYCAGGDMENMLKQQVLDLQADQMSTQHLASNQLRLWFATFGYLLMERLRALGLAGTELAQATAGSVRLKLLKIAAQVCPLYCTRSHLAWMWLSPPGIRAKGKLRHGLHWERLAFTRFG